MAQGRVSATAAATVTVVVLLCLVLERPSMPKQPTTLLVMLRAGLYNVADWPKGKSFEADGVPGEYPRTIVDPVSFSRKSTYFLLFSRRSIASLCKYVASFAAVFKYDPSYHCVVRVNQEGFVSCLAPPLRPHYPLDGDELLHLQLPGSLSTRHDDRRLSRPCLLGTVPDSCCWHRFTI